MSIRFVCASEAGYGRAAIEKVIQLQPDIVVFHASSIETMTCGTQVRAA